MKESFVETSINANSPFSHCFPCKQDHKTGKHDNTNVHRQTDKTCQYSLITCSKLKYETADRKGSTISQICNNFLAYFNTFVLWFQGSFQKTGNCLVLPNLMHCTFLLQAVDGGSSDLCFSLLLLHVQQGGVKRANLHLEDPGLS